MGTEPQAVLKTIVDGFYYYWTAWLLGIALRLYIRIRKAFVAVVAAPKEL